MGWWHNVEVGGWALLALWSYNTLAVHLPVGSRHNRVRGSGHIGAGVPVPHCLPPPCSLSGHCQCVAYPAPGGVYGMVGWWWLSECEGGHGWLSGVREVDRGWCQSLWQTKEWEWVVVVIRGERAEGLASIHCHWG
jgi:hypothetical protein